VRLAKPRWHLLRQQLVVLQRSAPARLRLPTADRLIFVWLSAATTRCGGAPRIHGELLKVGFDIAQSIVRIKIADIGRDRRPADTTARLPTPVTEHGRE
jgi:hypothetical protein